MEVAIGPPGVLLLELVDHFGDRIEAVKHQVVVQQIPADTGAALHADVDDAERLPQQSRGDDPAGEWGPAVEGEVFHVDLRIKEDAAGGTMKRMPRAGDLLSHVPPEPVLTRSTRFFATPVSRRAAAW